MDYYSMCGAADYDADRNPDPVDPIIEATHEAANWLNIVWDCDHDGNSGWASRDREYAFDKGYGLLRSVPDAFSPKSLTTPAELAAWELQDDPHHTGRPRLDCSLCRTQLTHAQRKMSREITRGAHLKGGHS